MNSCEICGRSLMDRTEASDAFNAGSIPVGRSFGSRNRGFRDLFVYVQPHLDFPWENPEAAKQRSQTLGKNTRGVCEMQGGFYVYSSSVYDKGYVFRQDVGL